MAHDSPNVAQYGCPVGVRDGHFEAIWGVSSRTRLEDANTAFVLRKLKVVEGPRRSHMARNGPKMASIWSKMAKTLPQKQVLHKSHLVFLNFGNLVLFRICSK